jgi:glucose/arabinose dehydrogenase
LLHINRNSLTITTESPLKAEELNIIRQEDAGKHFGYPFCWTEYNLPQPPGDGRGAVWAWPSFLLDGTITDEECRNNYEPPAVSMQGHSAPLGITFFNWLPIGGRPEACSAIAQFPRSMDGFAFIAFHGSWVRTFSEYSFIYFVVFYG